MKNKDYNDLVYEFRTGTCKKRRENEIIMLIEKKWLHLMLKRVATLPEREHDDFWQIYRMRILKAISKWKGVNKAGKPSMFTTYLCRCVIGTLDEYLWTNHKDQFKAKQLITYSNFDKHENIQGVRETLHDASWGTFREDERENVIGMNHQTSGTFGINGLKSPD